MWLNRDITSCGHNGFDGIGAAAYIFKQNLESMIAAGGGWNRRVVLTLDAGAICSTDNPNYNGINSSAAGLSVNDVLEIAMVAGANPNVSFFFNF